MMPGEQTVVTTASDRKAALLYLAVAFGITWTFWLLGWAIASHKVSGLPLFPVLVVGSFGPFVGAIAGSWFEGGASRTARFFRRALDPRMGWSNFLLSFFLIPAICVAASAIESARAHTPLPVTMTWREFPTSYLFLFFLGGAVAEEFGWSFLSDKLDALTPVIPGTLALGMIWSCWHVPLFFIRAPGAIQYFTPFLAFLVGTTALRFLCSWTYHRSRRNVLSNVVFHNASNLGVSIVAVTPGPDHPSTLGYWLIVGMTVIAAAIVWLVWPIRVQRPS